ncbi:hypothetical protein NDU88_002263 [Pleurodeles waltl]|uniref:Uncharacterized protein n=1 Tax=Pleurodeles waltl TaxID=8319 RepID=A0AAV7TLG7_PLEWA|nr:hypothetical protein NDU88_002263 [Pleurodeles waltl]
MGYIPFVQPDYTFQQRNSPKTPSSTREPPPMAGDGPQFLFPHPFSFNAAPSAPVISNAYFSSAGNGFTPDAFYLGQL